METLETLALTFLLNALWQVPAVVLAASLADRLLRRGPARLRHALWSAALLLAFLLPAASLLPRRTPAIAPPTPLEAGAAAPAGAMITVPATAPAAARRKETIPPALLSSLAVFYGLAVLFSAVRLARSWQRARALARTARPLHLTAGAAALMARCREVYGLGDVEILASDRIPGPLTLGALRPVILLPPELPAAATPEELTACLGHEMAHVRRRDYALHLLGEALLVPLSLHPAVRPLRRRLAETREMACDEATVERLLGARAYARSLLSLAASIAGLPRPVFTLGVHQPDTDTLEVRMQRLTDHSPRLAARRARALLATALLLLAGVGLTASALAVGAPAAAPDTWKPFLGVWHGSFANKDGSGGNLPGLDLEVRTSSGRPEAIVTMYRHLKQPDGSVKTDPRDVPVYDLKVEGRTLTFRQRYVLQLPQGRKEILDNSARLDLTGDGEGVLSFLETADRKDLPPPPPPIPMKRG